MTKGPFWRQLRILVLLYVLLFVTVGAWLARARSTDWDNTLRVAIYPVNADDSAVAADYIDSLDDDDFADVERFMQREVQRYGIALDEPLRLNFGDLIQTPPPLPPADRQIVGIIVWSLRLRYYAWRMQRTQSGPRPDLRLFVRYHDPATHQSLAHSVGLEKGLIGIVNAFASRRLSGSNNVVLAHELLHTLGASDKYDPATTLPRFPEGYGEPQRSPLYPQRYAEIMGGRIALTPGEAAIPVSLADVLLGPVTAIEIGLARPR